MPIYEFICKRCGGECEILVRSSSARTACPDCGSTRLEKKFSAFATRGSGGRGANCSSCKSTACSTCRR